MSDPFLLAAGFFAAGPLSVPPTPGLPPQQADNFSSLLAAGAARNLQSVVTRVIKSIEVITSPEFSNYSSKRTKQLGLTSVLANTTKQQPLNQRTLTSSKYTKTSPASGSQLYYQRLAALKAGKIYTRLPADSFQSFWLRGGSSQTQTLAKPTYRQWQRLLEEEAQAVSFGQGSNRLAILVGDSLSLWFPSEKLPGNQFWLNQAISGENSGQVLNRLSAFSQTRPDTIYVMAGTNDLRQGKSDRLILDNMRQIVQRLRQNHPQSQVIVQSILPTRLKAIPNQRIRNLNQQIALIAQQEGAGYLNLNSWFVDKQDQMQRNLTTDGVHLNRLGYEVWQEALQYVESWIAVNRRSRIGS
ncbi:MAG: acylhydrolase [Symploca sp. SIO1C4]|uniref:Acylhydrolase n=1 Tax=Symploca sp. SIO1C4 TaxID=2607765 RepID=A0A6B3NAD6_9CYAN|nr:acylhydrolase [Symploca sp. SIO1C4]